MSVHEDRHGDHWVFDGGEVSRIEEPSIRTLPGRAERAYGPFKPPLPGRKRCPTCGAHINEEQT